MYSQRVVEQSHQRLEADLKLQLVRYEPWQSWEFSEHLKRLYDTEKGSTIRPLKPEEKSFIRNERLMCSIDYLYWTRYAWIIADGAVGGGLQRFTLWASQQIIFDVIAKLEEEMVEAWNRGEPVDGILLAIHKARQLGATMLWRTLIIHRLTTQPHTLGVTASIDDQKVLNLYERDDRLLKNLPWFLSPSIGFNEKAQHIIFDKLDSSLLYQEYVQKTGLAQGEQYLVGHMTEVASADTAAYMLEHHYFPAIPQSPFALHGMESTAQGRGNWWHEFVEETRKGGTRWKLVFVPYYAEPQKYRRKPPVGWVPSEVAMLHAKRVYETSEEYIGRALMIPREQLYWWETTREEYRRKNELHFFLTNYCATVEESFQHSGSNIFNSELIDLMRSRTFVPQAAYELMI
jgi:hypothetical protein